ncbi:MAG: hypothetical protein KGL39_58275 [Patescibacteria group bacterium]|nr:hypothetical protein [Patescibacteria group bacterium]
MNMTEREQLLYDAFRQAALRNERAPTMEVLCALAKVTRRTIKKDTDNLERAGLLRIENCSPNRIAHFPDGLSTLGVFRYDVGDRLDELAEHIANGASLTKCERLMGVSKHFIRRAWRRICDDLGPQAV